MFVLTHHPRQPVELQGGTTFTFVTEGIEAALERARAAGEGRDVVVGGGAEVAQQYLRAGLLDEMELHVVPLLLGSGTRLFEHTDGRQAEYECDRVVASSSVAHFRYRRAA